MTLHHGLRAAAGHTSTPPVAGSFNHLSANSIQGTFGSYSRTANYCDPPTDLASGIDYGTQNSNPFSTSTDWNNDIVRAYAHGAYANRSFAPCIPALMERPKQGVTWPYVNNWESAWWLGHNGYHVADILIVVFDTVKTITGIEFLNGAATYNNSNAGSFYAESLTGTSSSFTQTSLGNVSWVAPGSSAKTINISPSVQAQAIAIYHSGSTGWTRTESIRFLK